jgi:NAD(P)-dependent dehydrogenase (short-subunit alcohol dehydrogenase family)
VSAIDFGLKDKSCVVTGASRGLGKAIAELLYSAGACVSLFDLAEDTGSALAERLDSTGERALFFRVDVTSVEEVEAAMAETARRLGSVDVLVNSAGIMKHLPIDEMSLEDFENIIKVNLTGTFITCKAAVPYMKKQGRGKIVNIASLGGRTGRPGVGVNYAASKAGVIGLTQTLAREQGQNGIYVNSVAPGPILTELTKQASSEVFATWNAGRAVKKDGLPTDVAQTVLYLASSLSDWVTGVTLDVNGGILIR